MGRFRRGRNGRGRGFNGFRRKRSGRAVSGGVFLGGENARKQFFHRGNATLIDVPRQVDGIEAERFQFLPLLSVREERPQLFAFQTKADGAALFDDDARLFVQSLFALIERGQVERNAPVLDAEFLDGDLADGAVAHGERGVVGAGLHVGGVKPHEFQPLYRKPIAQRKDEPQHDGEQGDCEDPEDEHDNARVFI